MKMFQCNFQNFLTVVTVLKLDVLASIDLNQNKNVVKKKLKLERMSIKMIGFRNDFENFGNILLDKKMFVWQFFFFDLRLQRLHHNRRTLVTHALGPVYIFYKTFRNV